MYIRIDVKEYNEIHIFKSHLCLATLEDQRFIIDPVGLREILLPEYQATLMYFGEWPTVSELIPLPSS